LTMYEVKFTRAAERYFRKLKEEPLKEAYEAAIRRIADDPHVGKPKRGDLAGIYGVDVHFCGVNYEIAYTFRGRRDREVVVLLAGTRENSYEQLKRYIK
jgi:mRNA interferase RelE/StbE